MRTLAKLASDSCRSFARSKQSRFPAQVPQSQIRQFTDLKAKADEQVERQKLWTSMKQDLYKIGQKQAFYTLERKNAYEHFGVGLRYIRFFKLFNLINCFMVGA